MIATMPLMITTHSTNKGLFDALFETSDWLVQPIIALALFIALSAMVGAKEGMAFKILFQAIKTMGTYFFASLGLAAVIAVGITVARAL